MKARVALVSLICLAAPAYAEDASIDIAPKESNFRVLDDVALLFRAENFLFHGDIANARRLLQVPAEDGLPTAMTAMGMSYDPIWLAKQHVPSVEQYADPE
jgi:hypothetical protein